MHPPWPRHGKASAVEGIPFLPRLWLTTDNKSNLSGRSNKGLQNSPCSGPTTCVLFNFLSNRSMEHLANYRLNTNSLNAAARGMTLKLMPQCVTPLFSPWRLLFHSEEKPGSSHWQRCDKSLPSHYFPSMVPLATFMSPLFHEHLLILPWVEDPFPDVPVAHL